METKINNLFEKHIAFGGLMELNESSILLRNKQIEDGVKIHTCNDYNNSIEVIKEANPNKKQTKIILKVYYNYPTPNNRRYRSIIPIFINFNLLVYHLNRLYYEVYH